MSWNKAHSGAATVAHNWAHKKEGKFKKDTIAGSLYYEGDVIYSYGQHFPIARHVIGKKGQPGILFTTRGYSNSTSKHLSVVSGAITHMTVIYCDNVPSSGWSVDHNSNFGAWIKEIQNIAKSLPKAKKPEIYIGQIEQVLSSVKKYSEFFGVKPNAIQTKFFKTPVVGFKAMAEKAYKEAEIRRIAAEKRHILRIEEEITEFRLGERKYVDNNGNTAYLRYNVENKRVETSKGIQIPVEMARRFYKWILLTAQNGGCVGDCKMKILDFEVAAVDKTQFIVGCHTIAMTEAQAISKTLGWKI